MKIEARHLPLACIRASSEVIFGIRVHIRPVPKYVSVHECVGDKPHSASDYLSRGLSLVLSF